MSTISQLLEKTSHWDKDERYMATNDLCTELSKDTKMDENVERLICAAVLKQLDDKSNDVQSVAVKCLAMLLRKVQPAQIGDICEKLCTLIVQGTNDLRDIYSIGLKTLISDVAESTGALVVQKALGRLLNGINNSSADAVGDDIRKECLDNLSELLRRFGHHVAAQDHDVVMDSAVRVLQLTEAKPIVRKRAAVCLGALSVVSGDALIHRLVTLLLDRIDEPGCSTEDTRTFISCICIISRDVGHRLGSHLPRIVPLFLRCCGSADDESTQTEAHNELRENCFPGLESFVLCCPREVASFLPSILSTTVVFMAYDPNFCGGDDGDGDGGDMDVEGGSEEEYEEEYEEEDWDQGNADEGDDDSSWKVRKAAVRLVASVLTARPELLSAVQEHCAVALVRRFQERVENVRLDVIACFHRLLQCVVASSSSSTGGVGGVSSGMGAVSLSEDGDRDSKRQRGLSAPLLVKTSDIVSAAVRQLKEGQGANLNVNVLAGVIKTKCALFAMLRVLTAALQGQPEGQGLQSHLPVLMELSVAAINDKHQALRLEALGFAHGVLDTQPAAVAQQYVAALVPVLVSIATATSSTGAGAQLSAVSEKDSSRLVVEGLAVIQKVVAVCHAAGDQAAAAAVAPLYAAVLTRFEHNDMDNEVKVSTMACVGFLVSSFGTGTGFDMPRVLGVLSRRLESESMRASAIKTLISIAQSPLRLDLSLCHVAQPGSNSGSIVDMAIAYTRVSSRMLRHTAIQLLNALLVNSVETAGVSSGAVAFPAASISAIVEAVTGCISEQDMFVCGQALLTVESVVSVSLRLSAGDASTVNKVLLAGVYQRLLDLTVSPLLQGATLEHLVGALRAMVAFKSVACKKVFSDLCAKVVPGLAKQSVACVSKCTVGVITSDAETTEAAIAFFTETLSVKGKGKSADSSSGGGGDALRLFALLCIGSLHAHLSTSVSTSETVAGLVLSCLKDSGNGNEELQFTAAVTLGQLAASNIGTFLPTIMEGVQSSNTGSGVATGGGGSSSAVPALDPLLYLYLVSLKECIEMTVSATKTRQQSQANAVSQSPPLVVTVLPLLVSVTSSPEESIRNIAAECLGLLMYTGSGLGSGSDSKINASEYILQQLTEALAAPAPADAPNADKLLRWTVITALKCCFSRPVNSVPDVVINVAAVMEVYLGLLRTLTAALQGASTVTAVVPEPTLLSLLDCELCKCAVLFINASVHYNATVMAKYLREGELSAFLLLALGFQQERVVDLGPFKHKVDDGMPVRKAALICYETMLDVLGERFDTSVVLQRLVYSTTTLNAEGKEKAFVLLNNDKDEVKFNGYQVLSKICMHAPGSVLGALDKITEVLTHLFKKAHDMTMSGSVIASASAAPAATAVAVNTADGDRLYELVRVACQVIAAINSSLSKGDLSSTSAQVAAQTAWKTDFVEKVVMKRPLLVNMLQNIQNEKVFE